MTWVAIFLGALVLIVLALIRAARRAGPRQVAQDVLDGCRALYTVQHSDDGPDAWSKLGSRTVAHGLHLRFNHDDDPQAEATMLLPGLDKLPHNLLSNRVTVRLGSTFETHHVHTGGFVFRVTMRGSPEVVGKQTIIQMLVDRHNSAVGGRIENDDDTDAAVGGWIEIEQAEVLQVVSATRTVSRL